LAPDVARLRLALATPADCARFRDVPVDWYDRRAGTWRPTAIAQAAPAGRTAFRVHVFAPIDEGIAMAPAAVDDLRLAREHSDAVTRFWTIRYRLRLFRTLAATLDSTEAAIVDAAIEAFAGAEAEMRDVWLTAYAHGVPPRHPWTLFRPSDVRIVAPHSEATPADRAESPDGRGEILVRAVNLYRGELTRLQGALWQAGLTPVEVTRHPLCNTLARLLAAAAGELVRRDPPGTPVALDPAVWG
jgi:hypothetical protein